MTFAKPESSCLALSMGFFVMIAQRPNSLIFPMLCARANSSVAFGLSNSDILCIFVCYLHDKVTFSLRRGKKKVTFS